ncbi:MAG: DUF5685 family protein [Emergencia sp.]|nr:DUF5685 family protein [Emergencia sp.]
MLGYVTIEKSELKVREFEVYQGYYCGICKSIGRHCGQIPRLCLSYDAVFLALLLAGLDETEDVLEREHCIIHPIQKKPVIYGNKGVDYAADVMVILAYHKFLDDWNDEKSPSSLAGTSTLYCSYRKLKKQYPSLCEEVETGLKKLSALEKDKSGSLDLTGGAFADIMETLFTGFFKGEGQMRQPDLQGAGTEGGVSGCGAKMKILAQLGRSLGKWIYAADALDDYEKDCRSKNYNPFIYRKNKLEGIDDLLYNYLAEISNAYDLLNLSKNRGIVENIIFMGIRRRTDRILSEKGSEQTI